MNKRNVLIIVVVIVLIGLGFIWWVTTQKSTSNQGGVLSEGITYFYGEECPHCKDVLKFIADNNISEKVSFEKREVWYDKSNQPLLSQAVARCKIDAKEVGVPFVYARGACYIGGPEVMQFFKKEAGIE